jgi:hypothetical protein
VRRFASGLFPLDEALIEVALDLSGRPWVSYDVPFGEVLPLGDPPFNPEMAEHFWQSFATSAGITLHVTKKAGVNTHHVVEATFKGVARCLRDAVRVEGTAIPSTKGTLSGTGRWLTPCPATPDRTTTPPQVTAGARPLIAVLDYGIGNLRSAQKALEHVGADARLTADPGLIADAAGVVLPGVGAFGRCVEALGEAGLADIAHVAAIGCRGGVGASVPRGVRGPPDALRRFRREPRHPRPGRDRWPGPAPARRGEAAADAVERAPLGPPERQ